jgi:hypothetical protein
VRIPSARADRNGQRVPLGFHVSVAVDPVIYKGYIGRYQLAPGAIFTITAEGGHLYSELTGQPRFEIFPESEREFFLHSCRRADYF